MSTIPSVILAASDLMRQSRILERVKALGYEVIVADSSPSLRDALDRLGAELVVLDLQIEGLDWKSVVTAARQKGLPVLAFGQHTDAGLLRQAREAGCVLAVPRSTVVEQLPQLLERAKRRSGQSP